MNQRKFPKLFSEGEGRNWEFESAGMRFQPAIEAKAFSQSDQSK
jgi:hypothetical protein